MKKNEQSEVIHVSDAKLAPRLGTSKATLRTWRQNGSGPPYYRVENEVPVKWLDASLVEHLLGCGDLGSVAILLTAAGVGNGSVVDLERGLRSFRPTLDSSDNGDHGNAP